MSLWLNEEAAQCGAGFLLGASPLCGVEHRAVGQPLRSGSVQMCWRLCSLTLSSEAQPERIPATSTPITIARYGRPRNKTQDFEDLSSVRPTESSQSFSPNLGSPSPPETPSLSHCVSCIGKHLLLEPLEGDRSFRAVHLHSEEELVCKVFDIGCYQDLLAPCFCLPFHDNINQITEIILGETKAYVFFERSYGDMHSFVRTCKKLKEEEAAKLFYQIASAVAHCHDGGLVLRDLKLRKFIFKDEERETVELSLLDVANTVALAWPTDVV
uniref:Tribbles 2 n=1 Tax=Sphaerodactylus townsendi TaxID=933632 RepID=A0ACB8GF56_9SAUR